MEWVETTGKTVEEAKDAALDQLGVDEHDAEFEVIEEPKMGLFGRLRSEARVRARVRPTTPRAKDERRDRRRRGGRSEGDAGAERTAVAVPSAGASEAGRAERGGDRGRSRGRGRGDGSSATAGDRRDGAAAREGRANNGGRHVDDVEVPLDQQGEVAEQFLSGLLAAFGATGSVTVRSVDEDTIELMVAGDELSTLIGPKGSTLAAVQELTRTVVQRKTSARNGRILVDVAGYRARRREALSAFTQRVAEQVISSGVAKALEPMTPADRKVVHDTVNGIDGVRTISQGEEPRRRVVIQPDNG